MSFNVTREPSADSWGCFIVMAIIAITLGLLLGNFIKDFW